MLKCQRWDGVNQVKMENQLVVGVKSEKPEAERTVNNTKLENMDTLTVTQEFDIKYECEDAISDRIKVEEKLEPGLEADSAADMVNQMKMEFQESEKLEGKPDLRSTKVESMDALELHDEFDIKTECNQGDRHDSASDSTPIKKTREKELGNPPTEGGKKSFSCHICNYTSHCKKDLIGHIKRNNCYLGSSLGKQYLCIKCNKVFKSKTSLDNHLVKNHVGSIASVCDFKTAYKGDITRHMLKHTTKLRICKHCNTSFKTERSLFAHILKRHPNFSGTISSKIYECMHCAHKQIARSSFIKHLAKHGNQRTFKCINCDASFNNERRLESHTLQKHPKIRECVHCEYKTATGSKRKCTKCDKSFTYTQTLDNHILQKHPELTASVSSKIHACTHCEYKTTLTHCLVTHMMKHTGAKLKCTKCDASFVTTKSLNNHILRKHPELTTSISRKIHECTHCEYKTTYKENLASHMMKHTGAKLKCTKCDKSFTYTQSLDDHILRKHPDLTASVSRKIHKCTHCEYKSLQKRKFIRHMMKHTEANLKCTKCDMSFTTTKSLDNHILRKHPEFITSVSRKIHKCTHCEYKTTYKAILVRHMMNHTGAEFTCTKCDASFTNQLGLDNHILREHPEIATSVSCKIHKCTHCEYKTTYAFYLANHMMKHTGAKLKCTKCDVSFRRKQCLDNHILQKHPAFTSSVSCKIHECTHCEYKTTYPHCLARHMLKHTQVYKV
ncbi:unnamed protein product [Acanthoscelides obtectus]|uniref:C2H2-type domain-containing protein n=2 Tax=Acanthoscelides obtectus TaxID=200917 RepID=A0A9P0Q352_ACAOB|nr:unnamed protein product [Acanthoscelides obtectus]CAK1670585.1 hypothetical protein AOBTE_LOCUS27692 [Acanthoscelides obtectus]